MRDHSRYMSSSPRHALIHDREAEHCDLRTHLDSVHSRQQLFNEQLSDIQTIDQRTIDSYGHSPEPELDSTSCSTTCRERWSPVRMHPSGKLSECRSLGSLSRPACRRGNANNTEHKLRDVSNDPRIHCRKLHTSWRKQRQRRIPCPVTNQDSELDGLTPRGEELHPLQTRIIGDRRASTLAVADAFLP